jgi:hypothetical protein
MNKTEAGQLQTFPNCRFLDIGWTPMIALTLNDRVLDAASEEAFDASLDGAKAESMFELWASVPDGPAMCMLRNGTDAWLMYLRWPSDAGFRSVGIGGSGAASYALSNGQVDEYPLSWCVDVQSCFDAFRSFRRHRGARPECIAWTDS